MTALAPHSPDSFRKDYLPACAIIPVAANHAGLNRVRPEDSPEESGSTVEAGGRFPAAGTGRGDGANEEPNRAITEDSVRIEESVHVEDPFRAEDPVRASFFSVVCYHESSLLVLIALGSGKISTLIFRYLSIFQRN